jgi:hypothetical protein
MAVAVPEQAEGAAEDLRAWRDLAVPRVHAARWCPAAARAGLVEIRRIRAALDAAEAALVRCVESVAGRDVQAALVRATGMSEAQARSVSRTASVIGRVPAAGMALEAGEVTAAHVELLAAVPDPEAAEALLGHAAVEAVDVFRRRVRAHVAASDGAGLRERQQRVRSLVFFPAAEGCVGMRAVLPPVVGNQVRSAIERRCDQRWRAAHPERAPVAGGHGDEPRDRRLADALVEAVVGAGPAGAGPAGAGNGSGLGRVGVIVLIDEATMAAHLAGGEPIAAEEIPALVADARTELYAAVRSMEGAVLRFGRSRRFASALQKLALVARDGGHCAWRGCGRPWYRTDADHRMDWERGGPTDLENLRLLCPAHHAHRHLTGTGPEAPDGPDP